MVHGEISICEFTVASITSLKITVDWIHRQTQDCTINGFFFHAGGGASVNRNDEKTAES